MESKEKDLPTSSVGTSCGTNDETFENNEEIIQKLRKINLDDMSDDEVDYETLIIHARDSKNPEVQLVAIQQSKEIVNPYTTWYEITNDLVKAGIIPIFVKCLTQSDHPTIQREAAEAVYYLTLCGCVTDVMETDILSVLLPNLTTPHLNEFFVQVLGHIIKARPAYRDLVIELGALDPLLSLVKSDTSTFLVSKISRVLYHICYHKDAPLSEKVIGKILPVLNELITHKEFEVVEFTLMTISKIAEGGSERIQMILKLSIVPKIIPLLSEDNRVRIQENAVEALSIISTDMQEDVELLQGAFIHFPSLVSHKNEKICRDAIRCLSNIIRNESQIQSVIEAGLLSLVVQKFNKSIYKTHKWAAKVTTKIFKMGTDKQIDALKAYGFIPPFCGLLSDDDPEVIRLVLDGLTITMERTRADKSAWLNSVKDCGGIQQIEALTVHEENVINKKATDLIKLINSIV